MSQKDDLLPCPFCFGSGLHWVPGDLAEHPRLDAAGSLSVVRTADDWFAVKCSGCYAMGPRVKATKAAACGRAIEAWNRRTLA